MGVMVSLHDPILDSNANYSQSRKLIQIMTRREKKTTRR